MNPPYILQNNIRAFDWHQTIQYLQYHSRLKHGPQFRLHKSDWPIIKKLILYHVQDQELCEKEDIDLKKGILLSGPIGCGKTSFMHLFQLLSLEQNQYKTIATRKIAYQFQKEGYDIIHKYGGQLSPICLDDLGLEANIKFFGNECNTIAEILLQRHENYTKFGTLTHATTNLNAQELEKTYGNRVRSRMREMFNLISFPESSPDKRK